jgi:hypothetical protein
MGACASDRAYTGASHAERSSRERAALLWRAQAEHVAQLRRDAPITHHLRARSARRRRALVAPLRNPLSTTSAICSIPRRALAALPAAREHLDLRTLPILDLNDSLLIRACTCSRRALLGLRRASRVRGLCTPGSLVPRGDAGVAGHDDVAERAAAHGHELGRCVLQRGEGA